MSADDAEPTWALDREIVLSRVFDAPRALVFRVWTEPEHVARWFGPRGFTTTVHEMEARVGGCWRFEMRAPDGTVFPNRVDYLEIVPPERLVFDHGNDSDDDPRRFRVTVTFDEQSDHKTVVTMRQLHRSKAQRDATIGFGAVELGYQTLDKLAEHLRMQGRPELRMSRVFDAPRRLVFAAWSNAEHVSRWFTPAPLTTPTCDVDLRTGGVFRVVMRTPDGIEFPMDARFTEVVRDERIVFTAMVHDDLEVHTTVTFAEHDGKTTLTVHQVYARETDATRGASAGWTLTLDQLAAHVRERT